ncbi:MAG: hypothetical protein HY521_00410 [Proteobacteria bacterium]|nr:hypothetical protein [Pseudomonadota bacterium]
MDRDATKETTGAWVIHHGRKVALDAYGASEFPVIDEASKAANLLARLGESKTTSLTMPEVEAVAEACRLNPRVELRPLLTLLESRRLIELRGNAVHVLGITARGALRHAADIFADSGPSKIELASIDLAEKASEAPIRRTEAVQYISDTHKLSAAATNDFMSRAEHIGFVDVEGDGTSRLLFNGNLFRRDVITKTSNVLDSLSSAEQQKMQEFNDLLKAKGCVIAQDAERILCQPLFEKLNAAGVFDLNTVSNDTGEHVFVTAPGAFHKFINPLIDDCFDMAKALVAALTYGMTMRNPAHGRIFSIELLLGKLIAGHSVGPATAIGMDYRVLEQNRVIRLTPHGGDRFYMRLLKREIGELALQVLTRGNANVTVLRTPPGAPMTGYAGPEDGRMRVRKQQTKPSKIATQDILSALRGGRGI